MKITLKALAAAALVLVVLFLAPIVSRTGQRVGLYLNCPDDSETCWERSGIAIMHGGRMPRR